MMMMTTMMMIIIIIIIIIPPIESAHFWDLKYGIHSYTADY